jgi:putative endonuclease
MVFPSFKATRLKRTSKQLGDAAEDAALLYLQQAGLRLLARNYRTPGRGGGEIDLIMCDAAGVTVFVEVRQRNARYPGAAAASVNRAKQQRLVFAAGHYLAQFATPPPCRFDVLSVESGAITWLQAAFDAQ